MEHRRDGKYTILNSPGCLIFSHDVLEMARFQVYGELKDGLFLRVTIGLARKLLQPDNVLLNALNK